MRALFLSFTLVLYSISLSALEPVRIALVSDGVGQNQDYYFQAIQRETQELLSEEFSLNFLDFHGQWDLKSVEEALNRAFNNPEVDIIVTKGLLSSFLAMQRQDFPKPTVVPIVFHEQLKQIPEPGQGSGIKNLVYLLEMRSIDLELKSFQELVDLKTLLVVGESAYLNRDDSETFIVQIIRNSLKDQDSAFHELFVPVNSSIEPLKEAINLLSDAQSVGVFLLPTPRLPAEEWSELIELINEAGYPSYSLLGEHQVEEGVFATMMPTQNILRTARRIALNIQDILIDNDAQNLEVHFSTSRELIVNEATAKRIGVYPPWRLLSQGRLIGDQPVEQKEQMHILNVVERALACNRDLEAERLFVRASCYETTQRKSALLPQLSMDSQALAIDADRARAASGSAPQRRLTAGVQFSQTLLDDKAWSAYQIEQRAQYAREWVREGIELDTQLAALLAYFGVLRAEAEQKIIRDNVELNRANLRVAEERVDSGEARLSEMYRWQSEIALSQRDLLDATAKLQNAETELNRLINRPVGCPIHLQEIPWDHPLFQQLRTTMGKLLRTPLTAERFREQAACLAKEMSPELMALCHQIHAQERALTAAEREFYVPIIQAQAEIKKEISRSGEGVNYSSAPHPDRVESTAYISLSYPLWTSGRRLASTSQACLTLVQLQTEYEALEERIAQQAVNAVDLVKASYFSMDFALQAAEAAQKNLGIISDSYARGVIPVIDLIDAQNTLITGLLNAADAQYRFLDDFARLQRSLGAFEWMEGEEGRASFERAFVEEEAVTCHL